MSVIIHRKLITTEEKMNCTLCGEALKEGTKGVIVIAKAGLNFETNDGPVVWGLCPECVRAIGREVPR